MNFSAPKYFNHNYIEDFLETSSSIFSMRNKLVPNVNMRLAHIQEITIVGLLLIYKFIDFTYQNNCFRKPNLITGKIIEEAWKKYEFETLINKYISNKDVTEQAYKDFKIQVQENFIIAPQPLLRSSNFSRESLKNNFLPKLNQYYKDDEKTVLMLFNCLSEVLLNFWEHAIEDNRSILIADGNLQKIEIACADNGTGVISSLKQNPRFSGLRDDRLLQKSVERGVTSKEKTNHMGYGLWIINEIVNQIQGKFYIYSEGYYLKNDYGKTKTGKCAYWKGTIVYLHLPLGNPVSISDLYNNDNQLQSLKELKINFI
nr:ATP-binding protein [uncultured Pedobacter sp.]